MINRRTRAQLCAAVVAVSAIPLAVPLQAQTPLLERLQVHGYLSQAYVTSSDVPVFGIPTEGTADYRNVALQFRYALSDNDFAVVQLGHRRMGNSVLTAGGADVELKWAFYQRRLGPASFRIGRVPLPGGMFNETRDVGTLLPFYRAPGNYYIEGIDAVDGAVLSYSAEIGRFTAESSVSYGGVGIEYPTNTPEASMLVEQRAEDFLAGQLQLHTPITGVSVGGGAFRWRDATTDTRPWLWQASLDVERERFVTRGEYRRVFLEGMRVDGYYAQGSLKFGRLALNAQADFSDLEVETPIGMMSWESARDLALGVSYAPSSNLVYKLEGHRAKGSNFDVFVDPMQPAKTNYFIASVAVSF